MGNMVCKLFSSIMRFFVHINGCIEILTEETKRLWGNNGKIIIFSACSFLMLSMAFDVISPYIFGKVIDSLKFPSYSTMTSIPFAVIISYIIVRLMSSISFVARQYTTFLFERIFSRDMAIKYGERIINSPRLYFKTTPSELVWRVESGLNAASQAINNLLFSQIPTILQLLMIIIIIGFSVDVRLSLFFILFISLFTLIVVWFFDRQVAAVRNINEYTSKFYSDFSESISNMDAVKYFGAEGYFSNRLRDHAQNAYKHEVSATKLTTFISFLQEVVIVSSWATITIIAALALKKHSITIGSFTMIHTYFFMIVLPLRETIMGFCSLVNYSENLSIFKNIDQNAELSVNRGAVVSPKRFLNLELRDVHFSYDKEIDILRGVSLKAASGQMIAIVGASGSGKSTLSKLLFRLYDIDRGEIYINNDEIKEINLSYLRSKMAIVSQENLIFADTIYNNISLGARVSDNDMQWAINVSNLNNVIDKLPMGIRTPLLDKGRGLSGGELQRINIARAVLRKPEILILDEATSALDKENEAEIWGSLRAEFSKKIILAITHRKEIYEMADLTLILDNGRIISGDNQRINHMDYKNIER